MNVLKALLKCIKYLLSNYILPRFTYTSASSLLRCIHGQIIISLIFLFHLRSLVQTCRQRKQRGINKSDIELVERTSPDGNISNNASNASMTSVGTPSYTSYGKFTESMTIERDNAICISSYEVLRTAKQDSPNGPTCRNDSADIKTASPESTREHPSDHWKKVRKAIVPQKRNSKRKRQLSEDGEMIASIRKEENLPVPPPRPKKRPVAKPRQLLKRISRSRDEPGRKSSSNEDGTVSPVSPETTKSKPAVKPRNMLKRFSGSKDQPAKKKSNEPSNRSGLESPESAKNDDNKDFKSQGICLQVDQGNVSSEASGTQAIGAAAGGAQYEVVDIKQTFQENIDTTNQDVGVDTGDVQYEIVSIMQELQEDTDAPRNKEGQGYAEIGQRRDPQVSTSLSMDQKGASEAFDQIPYEIVVSTPVRRKEGTKQDSMKQTNQEKRKTWHQIRDMVKEIELPRPNLKLPNSRNSTCDCYENHGVWMPHGRKIRLV